MATMTEIEKLTRDYADARDKLTATVQDLNDKREAIRRQYLPGIKKQVAIAKERKDRLKAAIDDSQALFKKPRTKIISGIKVGLKKAKGLIEWASESAVIKLIEKHFPEQADLLIKTTQKVLKKPLAQLTAQDLKKIGVTIHDTGDAIVIEPTDSEVDALVEALLKDDSEETAEEAA